MLRAAPCRELFEGAVTGALAFDKCRIRKEDRIACMMDKALANTAAEHARLVSGRVSVEIDGRLADDADAMVEKANALNALLSEMSVPPARLLFRLPATWAGIHAAARLEAQGLCTHLVAIFSLAPQAAAAAHARASLIQPSVGRLHAWTAAQASVAGVVASPRSAGEQETLADARCRDLAAATVSYCRTRGLPSKVMVAVRSVSDVRALAGVDIMLATKSVLLELASTPAASNGAAADGSLLDRRAAAEVGAAAASELSRAGEPSCGRRWLESKEAFEETLRENDGGAAYLLEEAVARSANNAERCEEFFE